MQLGAVSGPAGSLDLIRTRGLNTSQRPAGALFPVPCCGRYGGIEREGLRRCSVLDAETLDRAGGRESICPSGVGEMLYAARAGEIGAGTGTDCEMDGKGFQAGGAQWQGCRSERPWQR